MADYSISGHKGTDKKTWKTSDTSNQIKKNEAWKNVFTLINSQSRGVFGWGKEGKNDDYISPAEIFGFMKSADGVKVNGTKAKDNQVTLDEFKAYCKSKGITADSEIEIAYGLLTSPDGKYEKTSGNITTTYFKDGTSQVTTKDEQDRITKLEKRDVGNNPTETTEFTYTENSQLEEVAVIVPDPDNIGQTIKKIYNLDDQSDVTTDNYKEKIATMTDFYELKDADNDGRFDTNEELIRHQYDTQTGDTQTYYTTETDNTLLVDKDLDGSGVIDKTKINNRVTKQGDTTTETVFDDEGNALTITKTTTTEADGTETVTVEEFNAETKVGESMQSFKKTITVTKDGKTTTTEINYEYNETNGTVRETTTKTDNEGSITEEVVSKYNMVKNGDNYALNTDSDYSVSKTLTEETTYKGGIENCSEKTTKTYNDTGDKLTSEEQWTYSPPGNPDAQTGAVTFKTRTLINYEADGTTVKDKLAEENNSDGKLKRRTNYIGSDSKKSQDIVNDYSSGALTTTKIYKFAVDDADTTNDNVIQEFSTFDASSNTKTVVKYATGGDHKGHEADRIVYKYQPATEEASEAEEADAEETASTPAGLSALEPNNDGILDVKSDAKVLSKTVSKHDPDPDLTQTGEPHKTETTVYTYPEGGVAQDAADGTEPITGASSVSTVSVGKGAGTTLQTKTEKGTVTISGSPVDVEITYTYKADGSIEKATLKAGNDTYEADLSNSGRRNLGSLSDAVTLLNKDNYKKTE